MQWCDMFNEKQLINSIKIIDDWYLKNLPEEYEAVTPVPDQAQINAIERISTDMCYPELAVLYKNALQITKDKPTGFGYSFFGISKFLKTDHQQWSKDSFDPLSFVDEGIKDNVLSSKNLLIIAHDGSRANICIDLDPDMNGHRGQIILVDFDYNVALKLAEDITEYLTLFSNALNSDRFKVYKPDGIYPEIALDEEFDVLNWHRHPERTAIFKKIQNITQ